jgi:hypothetical protein
MDPIPGDQPGKRVSTLSLELGNEGAFHPMKKLIAMLFALALVTSSSVAFAECKPADDKKMDKKEAKAKKHKKAKKADKAEDKKDKM